MAVRVFSGLLVALACTLAFPAHASPPDVFGLGSRSTAMGGAVSADVQDFSATYYNPSGVALAPSADLSIGYVQAHHSLAIDGKDSQVDPVQGVTGGVAARGEVLELPLGVGVGVHLPDHRLSRAKTLSYSEPRWVLYENRAQLLFLGVTAAIRPLSWLAVGGGVGFLASTRGDFEITGTAVLPSGDRSEYDSQLRHEVDADLTAVRYPLVGVTLLPSERLRFALVYRGEAQIRLDVGAELRGDVDAGLLSVPARYGLTSQTPNSFLPEQWVVGSTWEPARNWHLGFDLTWVRWSRYIPPVSLSDTSLAVDAPPGLVELPPDPAPTPVLAPGFSNTIVPHLGIEYALPLGAKLQLPLRVGYIYEVSPVPPQSGRTNFVDSDRHVFSAGLGFRLQDPSDILPGALRLDTHAQYSHLPTRVTLKDNPADFVGDYRASGSILALGANLSLELR